MKTRQLSEAEYLATMASGMRDVTQTADAVVDIGPYVDAVPASERESHDLGDAALVYRAADGRFEHVLVSTETEHVYLVVVVDLIKSTIAGHHLLDLTRKYDSPSEGTRDDSGIEGFLCHTCGQFHDELPMEFGADAPAPYYAIPEDEREARCELTSDTCMIDEHEFFVRGCLEIPVVDGPRPFVWGVWTSLSLQNFKRMLEVLESPERSNEPPYFGWLGTSVPLYPETLLLKTHLHTRPIDLRPLVELEPTDHPLAVEQRDGITMDRVREIAQALLHPS